MIQVSPDSWLMCMTCRMTLFIPASLMTLTFPPSLGMNLHTLGITASANDKMHAIHIFNWQLHPVAPDFTRTRIHYLEKYSPSPGQLGAFLIQLSDACDDRLLQAPRRIFVRLRRLSLVRAWLYDIYQIPPSEVTGSTVNSSAKQPVAKSKSNLHHIPTTNKMTSPPRTSLMCISRSSSTPPCP